MNQQEQLDFGWGDIAETEKKRKQESDESVKKAASKKKQAKPMTHDEMVEKWKEILNNKKSSKTDQRRLEETYQGWQDGLVYPQAPKLSKAEALRMYARLNEIQREDKLRKMVETTPDTYHLVQTKDQLDWVCELWDEEPLVGIDTETTGLDIIHGDNHFVGMSISFPKNDIDVYIPTRHVEGEQLSTEYVMKRLNSYLSDKDKRKVLANAKFDTHVFSMEGVAFKGIEMDVMIAMWLLNENEPSFRLKDLANRYAKFIGVTPENETFGDLFGKDTFDKIPLDVALVYAAKDTKLTVKMYQFIESQFQRKELERVRELYYEIENPLLEVCVEMEEAGFKLDIENTDIVRKELEKDEIAIREELVEVFGDINFNSPPQLQKAMYDELGFKDLSGKRSTDKATLKKLAIEHREADLLLEYRKISKLRSSFLEKLPELVKSTGRVYGQFKQNGTDTGRFASKEPNLQQLPKKARTIFVAPEDKILIGSDFSQIEPRVLAHITGDEALKRPYVEGGDLYSTLAANTFGFDMEYCLDGALDPTGKFEPRARMKTGLLAVMYGTSIYTLSNQLEISQKEANKFIEDFYEVYPTVKAWIEDIQQEVKENEYVETLYGRKRRFPNHKQKAEMYDAVAADICKKLGTNDVPQNIWDKEYKDVLPYPLKRKFQNIKGTVERVRRQAVNAIIQGSAADIMKIALLRLYDVAQAEDFTVVATVHDEAILECPRNITQGQTERIERAMTEAATLTIPTKVDVAFMTEWGNEIKKEEWFKTM